MNNAGILTIIAVALIGILVVLVMNYQESQKSPVEKFTSSVHEMGEEIQDEIDDHTTN